MFVISIVFSNAYFFLIEILNFLNGLILQVYFNELQTIAKIEATNSFHILKWL